MLRERLTEELETIMDASLQIALDHNHTYIHVDHLFVAMLGNDCLASRYLESIDDANWQRKTLENHPIGEAPSTKRLPITIDAERVLMHADTFAFSREQSLINSVDVLLAMMAYDNPIKMDMNKAGLILENIMIEEYGPTCTWPDLILKTEARISKLHWLLMSKSKRQKLCNRLLYNVSVLEKYKMYREVDVRCNIILSVNPDHPDFIYMSALSAYRQKKYNVAQRWIEQLQGVPSHKRKCEILRAEIEVKNGNYMPMCEYLENRLIGEPENAVFLNNLGYYLYKQQQYEDARPYLEKAIEIMPEYAYPYSNLGAVLFRLGQPEEGISFILRSLELDKGNPYAYKELGIIYMETGDKSKAMTYFQKALDYKFTEDYGDEVLQLMQKLTEKVGE